MGRRPSKGCAQSEGLISRGVLTCSQHDSPGRRRRRRYSPQSWLYRAAIFIALPIVLVWGVWRVFFFHPRIPVPDSLPGWITVDLLPVNQWSRPGKPMEAMNGIVIHYVGNPGTTAAQNRSYFTGLARSHEGYASSNFIIGLEGEVLLCVPIGEVAYCSNDRNGDTLSIEVCHPDETGEFTPESYESLVRLVNWLREFYDLDVDDVIRHYDVSQKICPKYYVEHPEAWEQFRTDLGAGETRGGS